MEAKHYQPRIMPIKGFAITTFQAVGGFKVSRCVCVCASHTGSDVRDRHQREAGKSAMGLNVADF